jgi:hypothetical protein
VIKKVRMYLFDVKPLIGTDFNPEIRSWVWYVLPLARPDLSGQLLVREVGKISRIAAPSKAELFVYKIARMHLEGRMTTENVEEPRATRAWNGEHDEDVVFEPFSARETVVCIYQRLAHSRYSGRDWAEHGDNV